MWRRKVSHLDRHDDGDFAELRAAATFVCPSCGGECRPQIDDETGKPVRARGRAMLRCRKCLEIHIGPDPIATRRRLSIVVWILDIAMGVLLAAALVHETAKQFARTAEGQLSHWRPVIFKLILATFFLFAFHLILRSTATLIGRRPDHYWLETLLFMAFKVACVVVIVWIWWKFDAENPPMAPQ